MIQACLKTFAFSRAVLETAKGHDDGGIRSYETDGEDAKGGSVNRLEKGKYSGSSSRDDDDDGARRSLRSTTDHLHPRSEVSTGTSGGWRVRGGRLTSFAHLATRFVSGPPSLVLPALRRSVTHGELRGSLS